MINGSGTDTETEVAEQRMALKVHKQMTEDLAKEERM